MWQVLEDGSVLHINKTTIADTDQEGNTFFFHKSVVSTVRESAPEEEDVEENFGTEEEFEAEEEEEIEQIGEDGVDNGLIA